MKKIFSTYGGRHYFNNVAYGVHKAAIDRLCRYGARIKAARYDGALTLPRPGQHRGDGGFRQANPAIDLNAFETPQFVGRCIAALAAAPAVIEKTGEILITADVAETCGVRDINGNQPKSQRAELWDARVEPVQFYE